jgi:hypothetical protein
MKISTWSGAALISIALAGCISTQEMPLAPNVVRIDTQARGILFTGQAIPQTMRAAAQATLARGYTHFKFADAGVQQGSVVTGAVSNYSGTINGAYGSGYVNATSSGFGTVTAIDAPTANSAATVIMFNANEPEAKGAFKAEQVLKQYR